jgi:hypothetical protein
MPYIQYNDDPLRKRVSAAFANLCASTNSGKKMLRAFDKTLSVFNGANVDAVFSLANFIYPVDNQNAINFEVCSGETLVLFDNGLQDILATAQPSNTLENYPLGQDQEYIPATGTTGPSSLPAYYLLLNEKNYARGILLYVIYQSLDKGGNDVLPVDNKCVLKIWTGLKDPEIDDPYEIPLNSFFAHFSNPETRDANQLINRIEIVNPENLSDTNKGFSLIVTGLVLYTKSNSSISDCSC